MRRLILFFALSGLLAMLASAQQTTDEAAVTAPAEIVSLRTERSETFDNHDGSRTTRLYLQNKYYNENGEYKKIDLSVKNESADGYTQVVKAGSYIYRYDPLNISMGYRFRRGDYYVTFIPSGDWTGETSKKTPTSRGVKDEITLLSESDGVVSWKVNTNAVVSFSDGELTFKDSIGTFLFRVPRPWAKDAEGTEIKITASFSQNTLSYKVNLSDTVLWPVTVDPTTTVDDTDDKTGKLNSHNVVSWEDSRNMTEYQGETTTIMVGTYWWTGNWQVKRTALLFDTSVLPDGSVVDSARVVLVLSADNSGTDFDLKLIEATFSGDFAIDWFNDFTGWETSGVYSEVNHSIAINSSGISVGDSLVFSLTDAGESAISMTDSTIFMLVSDDDMNNNAISGLREVRFEDDSIYIQIWYHIPTRPTNFSMAALDTVTIACSWEDNGNEDTFYIINWADSSVVDSTAANAVADTISGLSLNTKYIWAVVADSAGVKEYSDPDSCYTLLAEPELSDIQVMPISSDTLRVFVTEPANSTSDSTGMEVYAVSGPGATGSGWLTGEYSYLDGELNPDSTYVYKVRYRNGDGDSTAWSPNITYSMNGMDTLYVYLGGDNYDDYNVDFGSGQTDSTVVRVGASDSGELLDGFLSFDLPWRVVKGGVDSLFLSLTRIDEQSGGTPSLKLYGIPDEDIDPVEQLNLGAQDSTNVTVSWTISSGAETKTSPDLRDIFRAWQDLAVRYGFQHGFGIRLDDGAQADSVRAVFHDASHPSYNNGTWLIIYYTPGEPDTLDGGPSDFFMTVLGPDSLRAEWMDNSTTEYGYLLCNLADSTSVAGVDSMDANTTSVNVSGLTPNTVYQWFVKAYTVYDDSTSSSDSERTLARVPGLTTVTALSDTTLHFIINPLDNPGYTKFAVQDSITGKYVDGTAVPDTLREGSPGDLGWRTYSQWGSAAGDTLAGLKPDSLYVIRAKARSED